MRRSFAVLLLACALGPPASAEDRSPAAKLVSRAAREPAPVQTLMLRNAIDREATRVARSLETAAVAQTRPAASQARGWLGRHSTLFGALVGGGAGAVSSLPRWTELYCATGGDEDCLFHGSDGVWFGIGAGAGIGALVGHLVGN